MENGNKLRISNYELKPLKGNVLLDKGFAFAIRVVKAYKFLFEEKHEFAVSKPFLRSGTSAGANSEEAVGGRSKADFVSKISIAYKEDRETKYWIRLFQATDFFDDTQAKSV